MAEAIRRIVVTRAGTPLGRRLLVALRAMPGIEWLRGVESSARVARRVAREGLGEEIDVVPLVPDHRPFAEYLEKEAVDTVIQCGLVPDRSGEGSCAVEADVISTMCLGAAISQPDSTVRSWVLASSTAIYPIDSHSSLMQRETQQLPREEEWLATSIADAEEYARDVARRSPHVNVAILRLQQLAGPGACGPLASLLARERVPVPIGFDPAIQLLHVDDAAAALAFAARYELAGVYNVASKGLMHWQDAVSATGHTGVPVLPVSVALVEPLLSRMRIPFVPAELLDLLRFGHVVDTSKLQATGWQPQQDQRSLLAELGRSKAKGDSRAN